MWERLTRARSGGRLDVPFDPHGGRRRRALLRDQCVHSIHEIEAAVDILWHDWAPGPQGSRPRRRRCSRRLRPGRRDRGGCGRRSQDGWSRTRDPLHVTVQDRAHCALGPILAPEVEHLTETVNGVHGVVAVESRLRSIRGRSTFPASRADPFGPPSSAELPSKESGSTDDQALDRTSRWVTGGPCHQTAPPGKPGGGRLVRQPDRSRPGQSRRRGPKPKLKG